MGHFPVTWCKTYGNGKVFYTSLGHREDVWENENYQKHILGAIKWALGLEPGESASLAK
jgi:type 1 glutamine amidotransferase